MNEIPEKFNLYAQFSKVDEKRRMVFGYATTPSVDSQGETIDLAASFEAVDEWKKWSNIKEMHRPETAVGTALIIEKHVGVGVYIGAEIVDDQAWQKCLKKVYKGFSIGGRVLKRHADNSKRITKYRLNEISLVDRYANPDSPFMVAKRDDASVTEADGGDSVTDVETKPKTEPSVPVAGEEVTKTPPKAEETEAKVTKSEPEKTEPVKPEPEPVKPEEEKVTVSKAEFEKLQSQNKEMEKIIEKRKEEDTVAGAILKAVERLEPKIKKVHDEPQPMTENEKKEDMKEQMSKMSVGELTSLMLKRAPTSSIKEE